MLTAEKIREMASLQSALNAHFNPDWMNANYDWETAILVECGELIDHFPWKWWKAGTEPSPTQVHLEIVDIWHFILSRAVIRGSIHALSEAMTLFQIQVNKPSMNQESLIQAVHLLCAQVFPDMHATPNTQNLAMAFTAVMATAGLAPDQLYQLYVAKSVLNLFRWKHGYNDGTYVKDWGGVEDNVFLEYVMEQDPNLSSSALTALLEARYSQVTA